MDNPRREQTRAALEGFQLRIEQGRVPPRRRYSRVIGGVVGQRHHQRRKRDQQRRNAYNWRYRP